MNEKNLWIKPIPNLEEDPLGAIDDTYLALLQHFELLLVNHYHHHFQFNQ